MQTEQEWCAEIVRLLTHEGWEVYQEVEIPGGRVDIVAVRGGIRWAIEAKTSMNLAVIDQARANVPYFHYSSLAVPRPKGGSIPRSWRLAKECGAVWGFGVIELLPYIEWRQSFTMRCVQRPRLNRRPLSVKLWEQQKDQAEAGGNRGGQWTSFKFTVQQLEHQARHTPGVLLREAIKQIEHGYGSVPSAVGCLSRYIRNGIINTLTLTNGRLYVAEPNTP